MPTFYYQALNQRGKRCKGTLESESQAKAFSDLQTKGLTPLKLSKVSQERAKSKLTLCIPWRTSIRVEEAFYYLGLMLQGGTSLAQGLELLGRMDQTRASRIWLEIRDSVESGVSFSKSLHQHPRLFPQVYIGMIQVAERTGRLGQILERIAAYEERRQEVQSKMLTALAYPLVIALIGLGAVYFLLANVLPRIAGIFAASDQDLPGHTRVLLSLSEWMREYGFILPILVLLLGLGAYYAYRSLQGVRFRIDEQLWKIPVLRDIILARFSGLLAFQLTAGISLVQAMRGALQGVDSSFFRHRMDQAAHDVATGQALDTVLTKLNFLPPMYLTALGAGQKAGQLPGFLERLSRILEHKVDNTSRRIIGLIEPLLILVLGLVVGFFVLAVMGPIFDLTSQI